MEKRMGRPPKQTQSRNMLKTILLKSGDYGT